MPVELEVKMDGASMGDFMIYHIYTSGAGMTILILGMLNMSFGLAFFLKGRLLPAVGFFLLAALIFVFFPALIRKKVEKQVETSSHLREPIHYLFDEEGIETITSRDRGKASWERFKRAVQRKRVLILYDYKKQAIILPLSQIEAEYEAVVDLIRKHISPSGVRIPKEK